MQLTPWYRADPLITMDGDPSAIAGPVIRQRRRLVDALASFDDEQWAHPSRCDGWSNRDVITHLDTTNTFWNFSIAMARKGEPTQFLATFDPVASPAQLVADAPTSTNGELLERFAASSSTLADLLTSLSLEEWLIPAESPVGHVSMTVLAHQAVWDALVHERDIFLPLGLAVHEHPDEVMASLRFVAALGPAFALTRGALDRGELAIEPTDVADPFTVQVTDRVVVRSGADEHADVTLSGRATDLLDALSLRTPLEQPVPEGATWLFDGLKVTFDQAPA